MAIPEGIQRLIDWRDGQKENNDPQQVPNAFATAADSSMRIAQGALDQQNTLSQLMQQAAAQQTKITNDILPELKSMAGQVRGIADKQIGMADDIYGRAQKFVPVESQMIADAQNGVTADVEGVTGQASADMAQQFKTAGDDRRRMLMAYGINPNSGRFAASEGQLAGEQALQTAGAVTRARRDEIRSAEDRNFSRRATVAGMGIGLTGQASSVASGANAGLGSAMNAYGGVIDSAGKPMQAYGTAMQGAGAALSGASNLFNSQSQLAIMQAQNERENALQAKKESYIGNLSATKIISGSGSGANTSAVVPDDDKRLAASNALKYL